MNSRIIKLATIVAGGFALLSVRPAFAMRYYDPATLRGLCLTNNGTFLPPTADSPVYVCMGKGGGIIICGGIGKWAKTCESGTFLKRRDIRKRFDRRL
jgi:hypothetical protein